MNKNQENPFCLVDDLWSLSARAFCCSASQLAAPVHTSRHHCVATTKQKEKPRFAQKPLRIPLTMERMVFMVFLFFWSSSYKEGGKTVYWFGSLLTGTSMQS